MTPDDDMKAWLFGASEWWIGSRGGFTRFADTATIVTPTEDDFPVDLDLEGAELAEDYFEFVLEHAGLGPDWHFELVLDEGPDVAGALSGIPHHMTGPVTAAEPVAPLVEGEALPIPYDVRQLEDPMDLVATMARGISHYLLQSAPTPFPGTDDEREYFVDLGATLLGFGIMLANASFAFHQSEQGMMVGWGYHHRGALGEVELSYLLATMATILELPDGEVVPHLRPNPRSFFKSARKDLTRRRKADLAVLRSVPSTGAGPYR
ncbi:MAG: hypothetical protein JJ863_09040 [Deltaproteobacteria bacterium]|nr:hypothetical protein [Deltaproteobacteria bacterium]